ncbi:sigma 54-interacting transcriptional regulator [Alkaliphilus sp. MSJ-5]|uniref:Sigma 54-interacting transcriptional regulator n=1 Tax=Alkaliphilus flagellatus TaxID=2841507 RepID=A0ABS6G0K0_9FIRM|nr:sigma 54-interacting transcriptional regulator [Alkaliphilus flagellatus]MBU5676027.1 sigma 54-interacting transcriptional regulator [Alkaliphilus flagellatus]
MQTKSWEELNHKLLVAKKYIETIIDSISTGIFTTGPNGYIKTINRTASEILGLSQEEVLGVNVSEIIEKWESIQQSVSNKTTYLEEEAFIKGQKGRIHCILSAYPIIESEQYKYEGIVCTINEIKSVRNLANKVMGKQALYTFDKIIGKNKEFSKLLNYAKQISNSPSTVLITGESGTGKEVFAQSIHNESSRRNGPFVAINCGALPRDLIESELFGYEEGAFTGAIRGGRPGKFELADGGTLFLDEIGEMPIDMQTNLLRVLEKGKLFRIGGNREIEVDVRIIAATNRDLQRDTEDGYFRKDLFYRLNVLPLKLLPLRNRKDDIPLLIDYFIKMKSLKLGKTPISLSSELIDKMVSDPWQGNIRELENTIERIINAPNSDLWQITETTKDEVIITMDESLEAIEKAHIEKIIDKCEGNISTTAEILGIGRNTLYRKIKKYSIVVLK